MPLDRFAKHKSFLPMLDDFRDRIKSVRGEVEIDESAKHPTVIVTHKGRQATWTRPTFRSCFNDALDWVEERER